MGSTTCVINPKILNNYSMGTGLQYQVPKSKKRGETSAEITMSNSAVILHFNSNPQVPQRQKTKEHWLKPKMWESQQICIFQIKLDCSSPVYQEPIFLSGTLNLKINRSSKTRDKGDFLGAVMSYLPPTLQGMRVTAGLNQTSGGAAGKQDLNTQNRGSFSLASWHERGFERNSICNDVFQLTFVSGKKDAAYQSSSSILFQN